MTSWNPVTPTLMTAMIALDAAATPDMETITKPLNVEE